MEQWQRAWCLALGELLALVGLHTPLTAKLAANVLSFVPTLLASSCITAACFGFIFATFQPRLGRASGLFVYISFLSKFCHLLTQNA
jgi:hypothetical protein